MVSCPKATTYGSILTGAAVRVGRRHLRQSSLGRTGGLGGGGNSCGGEGTDRREGSVGLRRGTQRGWGILDIVFALFGGQGALWGEAPNQRLSSGLEERCCGCVGRSLLAALQSSHHPNAIRIRAVPLSPSSSVVG